MKLGIFSNFGPLSGHVGGSEAVIAAISKGLIEAPYNCEVSIYAYNYKQQSICEGVNLIPCERDGSTLISQINENDDVLFYSDSFWNIDLILNNIDKVSQKLSMALVGAYFLQSHPQMADILKKNIDKFNLITHSSTTPDYKWCADNNLPVTVIPNGVDLGEFENNIDFRKKYNIQEKYILLLVSNFFYGKGQEILSSICEKLNKLINKDDYAIVSISSSIDYPYDKQFLYNCQRSMEFHNHYFLRDIPREDVVSAFNDSDIFLFTSKKEVSPLVILEAEAAGLLWISMGVGDIEDRKGGIIIESEMDDEKGYKVVSSHMVQDYANTIALTLRDGELRSKLKADATRDIIDRDWARIVPMYNEVFTS